MTLEPGTGGPPPDTHYVFEAGGVRFAVPLAAVRRVYRVERWTPVPRAPRHLLGMTQMGNELFALVDLGSLAGAEPPAAPLYAALLESADLRAGLVSPGMGRPESLDPEEAGPPPGDLAPAVSRAATGRVALEGSRVVVLDPARLLEALAPRWPTEGVDAA